ncbi:hypothetical protein GBN63_20345 [Pectobacterium carotovorum]|nr:hypothetical protein GBN63_20345 [Pectobacterium carotovorum]
MIFYARFLDPRITSVNVYCSRCQSVQVYFHEQNPKGQKISLS